MDNKSKINQKQVNGDYYERNVKSFDSQKDYNVKAHNCLW